MSVNFNTLFSATDAAFGVTGTWTPTGQGARTITMVLSDMGGDIQTREGVFVPDCDSTAYITKSGTVTPARGDLIVHGTVNYDVVAPAREDATRIQWELSLKKRC
jgi:hypothetical protein